MITINNINKFNSTIDLVGLSSDTKPLDKFKGYRIKNGSSFYEMNSKKAYIFSEEDKVWYEV